MDVDSLTSMFPRCELFPGTGNMAISGNTFVKALLGKLLQGSLQRCHGIGVSGGARPGGWQRQLVARAIMAAAVEDTLAAAEVDPCAVDSLQPSVPTLLHQERGT